MRLKEIKKIRNRREKRNLDGAVDALWVNGVGKVGHQGVVDVDELEGLL